MSTQFSVGRRWLCTPKDGRARFWFIVLGPGTNYKGNPATNYKKCRIEILPEDKNRPGAKLDGLEITYSHKHIKKHAVLVPEKINAEARGWRQATPSDQLKVLLWSIEGDIDNVQEGTTSDSKKALQRAISKLIDVREILTQYLGDDVKW